MFYEFDNIMKLLDSLDGRRVRLLFREQVYLAIVSEVCRKFSIEILLVKRSKKSRLMSRMIRWVLFIIHQRVAFSSFGRFNLRKVISRILMFLSFGDMS